MKGANMSKGSVYIVTNEAMPGLVKIGKTTRSVEQRAAELTHTGIPFPFEVACSVYSPNCSELEKSIHDLLSECRVNLQREFFLCDLGRAEAVLKDLHRQQIDDWLDEFMPDCVMQASEMALDDSIPAVMASHVEMHPFEVVEAYRYLLPSDMIGAIDRMRNHRSGIDKMKWLEPKHFSSEVEK
jgi:hypothetical protein